jgi:unsaturated rhamnogalacturonyl hydrolase
MPITLVGFVAAAALFACTPMTIPAQTGLPGASRIPAPAGDAPSDAGPLASNLSSRLTRRDLARAMKLVGDWQLHRLPADAQYEWTFAALYAGMMAVPAEVAGDAYKQAMQRVGEQLRWQPGPRVLHADDQAVGQM